MLLLILTRRILVVLTLVSYTLHLLSIVLVKARGTRLLAAYTPLRFVTTPVDGLVV